LRPVLIVTVGPVLLGFAFAVACYLALPRSRRVTDVTFALVVGIGFGLAIFGPIAVARSIGKRRPDLLYRHSYRIHWYTSAAMGLALGYLLACFRHGVFDRLAGAAMLVVFLGAVVKIALGSAYTEVNKLLANAAEQKQNQSPP